MNSFKKIAATAAAVALTFTGASFSSVIASNNSNVFTASITAEAVSIDQYEYFNYTDTYGTWRLGLYDSKKDRVNMRYIGTDNSEPKVYVCGFTPKYNNSYVNIPTTVNGSVKDFNGKTYSISNAKVVGINYEAFKGKSIESIYIPSCVEVIESSAFENCKKLTTVSFGNNSRLRVIHAEAFRYCSALRYITLPNSLKEFSGASWGDPGIFYGCSSLTNITIPSSVTKIPDGAFTNCSSLKNVNINLNKTAIGNFIFDGCSSLRTINSEAIVVNNNINSKFRKIFEKTSYGENAYIDQVMDNKFKSILSQIIKPNMNEFQKAKAIHDWICKNVVPDPDNVPEYRNHTDYGAFINGTGVCDSYARAFTILAQKAGLEAYLVDGEYYKNEETRKEDGHAWNVVKLNGNYYHVDCYWDDEANDTTGTKYKNTWFARSDSFIRSYKYKSETHVYFPSDLYKKYNNPSTIACTTKLGDGNCDGKVDGVDMKLIRDYVSKKNPTIKNKDLLDLNFDGRIDITDLSIITSYLDF